MTGPWTRLLAVCGGALVGVGVVGPAAAYCVDPNFTLLWGELDEPDIIPVYVSIGEHTSVEHTGLTTAEVVRLTREIIARHNEAAAGPTLVFMGLSASDMDYGPDAAQDIRNDADHDDSTAAINARFGARPFGITVDSYSCEYLHEYAPCGGDLKLRACAKTASTHPKARVTLVPVDCIVGDDAHTLDGNDLATVMLHEFGHTLGLDHSQISKEACEQSLGHVHGNAVDGNAGVMHAKIGGNFPALREWRRDDVEGLAALYGPSTPSELIAWDDVVFPGPPSEDQLVTVTAAEVRRPPAVSSATASSGARVYLATTDVDDRVVVYAHDTDAPAGLAVPELVDPGDAGRTWGNPGIALSDTTVFVTWSAHEQPDDSRVALRWATRPIASADWTHAEVAVEATSRVKRLAAGHVPVVDRFAIVSLTDYGSLPRILLIDPDAELATMTVLDGPPMFDIGGPACVPEGSLARCMIPYSTNQFSGPKLGWLEIAIDELGSPWVIGHGSGEVDATGKLGFAGRPDAASFRGSAGAQRYDLDDLDHADASPTPPPELSGHSWPIAIASTWSDRDLHWWGYARRRVECGDGLRSDLEQCDDGNQVSGDGCSASCSLEEPDGDLDPGPTGEDESGGAGLDGAEDCDCRSTPSAPPVAALALILIATLGRSRRAASASPP